MRLIMIATFCLLAQTVAAQDDSAGAQVAAANANALAILRSDICSARITPKLTVGQFLEMTRSTESLQEMLGRARQIGGPRWIDDQTCQVRLEISGSELADWLESIARERSGLSPLPAESLGRQVRDWKNRVFTATGTSVSADKVARIRPVDDGQVWIGVSDEARQKALAAARQDAAQRILDSIGGIELSPGVRVDAILSDKQARQKVAEWICRQPVTQVRFGEGLQVELTIAVPSDDLLREVLSVAQLVKPGQIFAETEQLRREFSRRVFWGTGLGGVNQSLVGAEQVVIGLPAEPPAWVGRPLDAEGTASFAGSALRTKRAAEDKAQANLRARVMALPLSAEMTIEQAARQNPRIAEAVERTLLRARVFQVETSDDSGVLARITIDTNDLWSELQKARGL